MLLFSTGTTGRELHRRFSSITCYPLRPNSFNILVASALSS